MNGLAMVLALLLLSACRVVHSAMPDPTSGLTGLPKRHFDGSERRVDLLARAFLPRGRPARRGFAYYSYLLFRDRGQETVHPRRAAAIAFLDLLNDVSFAPADVQPARMAVLYAPMQSAEAARLTFERKTLESFLNEYDYDRARLLTNAIGRDGERIHRVALIGYPSPIEPATTIDPNLLCVVNLDLPNDIEVERRVIAFRDHLEIGETASLRNGVPVALDRARSFFRLVGMTLEQLATLAAAAAS